MEAGLKKAIDRYNIYNWIKNVKVIYSGKIYNPRAKNAITNQSMFLKQGVKLTYEFSMPIGYGFFEEYEYYEGTTTIYVTPKQFTFIGMN